MLTIAYSPIYQYKLPKEHRFPMEKYELVPQQLLYEGTIQQQNLFSPKLLKEEEILLTHTAEYWNKLKHQTLTKKEIRPIGFPMMPQLVERGRVIAHGTYECCLFAKQFGVSLNVAGGTHHAFAEHGEGFCVLNDFAIAANLLLHRKEAKQILIIDLDVHQGNGTAHIFANESRVFTFSMHGENNYPFRKQQSDVDIGLPDGCEDDEYLSELQQVLPTLIKNVKPDMLMYLSGVDVLATDKLGRLNVTIQGCKQRDQFVFQLAKQHNIPIAVSMGGGYSPQLATIIEAHANTFRVAKDIYS